MYIKQAQEIFYAAIKAVQPQVLLPHHVYVQDEMLYLAGQEINISSFKNLIVIAAGKAAPAMAKEAEKQLGNLISKGICITKYGHAVPLGKFQTIEAAHPLPDKNSILAGELVLKTLQMVSVNDVVLILLSGGASSLLADVPEGCSLVDIQHLSGLLVHSGASIEQINIVRKHISGIKGGQLAKAAYPAKVFTLIISDVVSDDLGSIASGPTVPDHSTFADAYKVLEKYNIWIEVSESVRTYITKGLKNEIDETPKPGSLFFKNTFSEIIGNNNLALEAAKICASQAGYHVVILNNALSGDTDPEARKFVQYLLNYDGNIPACFIMGGETTLKVTGNGKGGRNQHFALCALHELLKKNKKRHDRNIVILSAGTDGTDGPTDAAGAVIDTGMIKPGMRNKDKLNQYLVDFDAYSFFDNAGGLMLTGPTQTNVMDIVIGLINRQNP
jgi:glycerate 2-kinase